MRRTFAIALVMLLMPGLVSAQRGQRGGRGMGMMGQQNIAQLLVERKDSLGLDAEQVVKLEALAKQLDEQTAELRQEIQAARGAGRGASPEQRQAMMQKLMELREANTKFFDEQIKPLLTPEQASQAAELMAGPPGRGRGRRGGGGGGR